MNGLLIKSPWIEEILAGRKTWEIRGSNTRQRGPIALIRSTSGQVSGMARLANCLGPLSRDDLLKNIDKHRIPKDQLMKGMPYPKTFAWVLEDARPLETPVPYNHPQGAVIWVKLPDDKRFTDQTATRLDKLA
jgi:hypothetical protein